MQKPCFQSGLWNTGKLLHKRSLTLLLHQIDGDLERERNRAPGPVNCRRGVSSNRWLGFVARKAASNVRSKWAIGSRLAKSFWASRLVFALLGSWPWHGQRHSQIQIFHVLHGQGRRQSWCRRWCRFDLDQKRLCSSSITGPSSGSRCAETVGSLPLLFLHDPVSGRLLVLPSVHLAKTKNS